ncbi:MAG: restriction endonuclease subunit S [Bacteroidales bacterium]|nr:restriction endonuclease subunit S [Bacteroidales bacterium]
MKFDKGKWIMIPIGGISKIQYGSSFKSTDLVEGYKTFRMNELLNGTAIDCGTMKTTSIPEKEFLKYKLNYKNILFNRTNSYEHVGRTGIFLLEGDYMFASYLLRLEIDQAKANPFYINTIMNSDWFQTNIKYHATKAVGQANINAKTLSNFKIPLPPLNNQNQIVTLIQSVEASISQAEEQEKNLKGFWLNLINEFVNERPIFGNLLEGKKLLTVTYKEVTEKLMRKINPISYGIEKIVAGENLETEDLKIRTWQKVGEGYLGPAFHVLFKPGDILYGSRRTYLKKVAFADFDGVCSNTTYVIKAKGTILLQDLLKHIMLSDMFTKYSIGVSKGSTNPYINWKDLDNFTFQIPDLQTQKEIAKVLDDIVNLIEDFKTQKSILKTLKQNLLSEILG